MPDKWERLVEVLAADEGWTTAARLSERVFTEMRQIVFARVMARSSRMVMLSVFRHLHALSLRFHLNRRTGGVTTRALKVATPA